MQMKSFLVATAFLAGANAFPLADAGVLEPRSGPAVTGDGLKWYDSNLRNGNGGVSPASKYHCYSGPASNYPAKASWESWSAQWNKTLVQLGQTDNTATENGYIKSGIIQVSKEAKVDARIITAMMMQESSGRVRVQCTTSPGGVSNCGLLQAHNSHSYDPSNSQASILQMLREGAQKTDTGDGVVTIMNKAPANENIWNAMRVYNSGAGGLNPNDLNQGGGATNSYVTDIANRVLGWDGSSRACS